MPQRIKFPPATTAWAEHLDSRLPVPVGGGYADGSFVRVVRSGGTRQTRVTENAQMTFECYGEDGGVAEELASEVESLVFAAAGTTLSTTEHVVECKKVTSVSGPSFQRDPDRPDLARYVVTALTALKGAVVSEGTTA